MIYKAFIAVRVSFLHVRKMSKLKKNRKRGLVFASSMAEKH